MKVLESVGSFLEKYFLALILVVALLAMLVPQFFIDMKKLTVFNQSLIVIGLTLIMFVMGLTTKKEDFKVVFTRPKDVLIGVLAQYMIMPALAYFLSRLFNLPAPLAVGLVLLGTCPGGTASNVMTYLAKGDVALSVGMTAVTTLLAPVMTPILTYVLADNWIKISVSAMFLSIVKIVVVPILLGMLVHYFLGEKLEKVQKVLVIIPIVSILMIMGMSVAPNKANLLGASVFLLLAVALHNWAGFLFGYFVGYFAKMDTARKKALSMEVGLQNSGLAVGLAAQFSNPLVAIPAVLATVIHQISGSVLANVFSRDLHLKTNKTVLAVEGE